MSPGVRPLPVMTMLAPTGPSTMPFCGLGWVMLRLPPSCLLCGAARVTGAAWAGRSFNAPATPMLADNATSSATVNLMTPVITLRIQPPKPPLFADKTASLVVSVVSNERMCAHKPEAGNKCCWLLLRLACLAALAGDPRAIRPELHQVALGDHTAQAGIAHHRDGRLPTDEECIGLARGRGLWQRGQWWPLPLADALAIQVFAASQTLQELRLGERADHTATFDHWQLRDAILVQTGDRKSTRLIGRDTDHIRNGRRRLMTEHQHVSKRRLGGRLGEAVLAHPGIVIHLREVAASVVGQQHHQHIIWPQPLAIVQRGAQRGSSRAAAEDALFARQPPSQAKGRAIIHANDLIHHRGVPVRWQKICADAFDFVGARLVMRIDRASGI